MIFASGLLFGLSISLLIYIGKLVLEMRAHVLNTRLDGDKLSNLESDLRNLNTRVSIIERKITE